MGCFLLPITLLGEIEKVIRHFWWCGSGDKGVHCLSWGSLCRTKKSGGLGFRDLESFNLAMLVKQAWRLITKPDSLLARVLRAKYYPREGFFTAALGDRPSYTWRSLMSARRHLLSGIRKRIGNGASSSIWEDRWVSSSSSGRLITRRPPDLVFPEKVGDLINWQTWSWNYELLDNTFWPVDVYNILRIPIGDPDVEDKIYWAFSKTGTFTVRSCYFNILASKGGNEGDDTTLNTAEFPLWGWIWDLKIPPKVKMFIWRGCHEVLPTRSALMHRRIGTNPFCPFCYSELETVVHLFFLCPVVRPAWCSEVLTISTDSNMVNFSMALSRLRALLGADDLNLVCVIAWNIWNLRNEWIHEGRLGDLTTVAERSRDYLMSMQASRIHFPLDHGVPPARGWQPPIAPFVKINFDAAVLASGFYHVAPVARDPQGKCLRWRVARHRGSPSPVVAEAAAAGLAIWMAREMHWSHVLLEGDCMQVVKAFKDKTTDGLREFEVIISTCFYYVSDFSEFRVSFVRRLDNCLTHMLAHRSFSDTLLLEGFNLPVDLA